MFHTSEKVQVHEMIVLRCGLSLQNYLQEGSNRALVMQ